jgi:hypothetical protein
MRAGGTKHRVLAATLIGGLLASCSLLLDPDSAPCAFGPGCPTAPALTTDAGLSGAPPVVPDAAPAPLPSDVQCLADSDCASMVGITLCDTVYERCVECLSDADCARGVCATNKVCVDCMSDSDCPDPLRSRCNRDTNKCIGCQNNSDCTHVPGKPTCDPLTRQCVECSAMTEDRCGGMVCDLVDHTCTSVPRASKAICEKCEFDSECPTGNRPASSREARCVPMSFGRYARGGYCLARLRGVCSAPFTTPIADMRSTSGAMPDTYCGIDQQLTTCEAVRGVRSSCAGGRDSECGADMLPDGRCRTIDGTPNQCTYDCADSAECPAMMSCDDGFCQ